jgi:hypothetical protein
MHRPQAVGTWRSATFCTVARVNREHKCHIVPNDGQVPRAFYGEPIRAVKDVDSTLRQRESWASQFDGVVDRNLNY